MLQILGLPALQKALLNPQTKETRKSVIATSLSKALNQAYKEINDHRNPRAGRAVSQAKEMIEQIADVTFFSQLLAQNIRPSIDHPETRNNDVIKLFADLVRIVPQIAIDIEFESTPFAKPDKTSDINTEQLTDSFAEGVHRPSQNEPKTTLKGYEVLAQILLEDSPPFPANLKEHTDRALEALFRQHEGMNPNIKLTQEQAATIVNAVNTHRQQKKNLAKGNHQKI